MHQARFSIHTDVRLHPEVPLIALLGLVHLGIALSILVLGRTRRGNDGGIHHRAGLEHQALLGQGCVDRGQHLGRQLMLFQQVPEPQNGRLIRQSRGTVQAHEASIQRPLMQLLFHRRVAQVPPQLQAVDAQHCLDRKRRASAQRLMRAARVRLNERHQRAPRHDLAHLFEEDLLAGLLGQGVKAKRDLIHVRDRRSSSGSAPAGMTRGFADLP